MQQVSFYTLTSGAGDAAADPRSWVVKGSNDGQTWKLLDERRGERFAWREQTRPFKLERPGDFAQYRIEFGANGGADSTTLAEVELLTSRMPDLPLTAKVDGAVAWVGDAAPIRVTVTNSGGRPAGGEVSLTGPEGWQVAPAARTFGPLGPGESQTVSFDVTVPAGSAAGSYPVEAAVSSGDSTVSHSGSVQVIGDVVEFTPGTDAEQPWLLDADGSQLDGEVFDGHARFADGGSHFAYRFDLPSRVTGGRLTLDIGNQFLVRVSPDGQSWRTVLEETQPVRDLSNRRERPLDLNELRGQGRTLFVRVEDSQKDDGWGGWLARLKLELQTG
jgi:hypothetical protein